MCHTYVYVYYNFIILYTNLLWYMHTLIRVVFCIMRDYSAEANYHDLHKMVIATAVKLSGWRNSQMYIFWETYVIMFIRSMQSEAVYYLVATYTASCSQLASICHNFDAYCTCGYCCYCFSDILISLIMHVHGSK